MSHLFNFQTQSPNAAQMRDLVLTQPAFVKGVGNAVDPGFGDFVKSLSPLTDLIWRYGNNEKDYMQGTVDQFVSSFMAECLPVYKRVQRISNIIEFLNESQVGDENNSTRSEIETRAKRLSDVHVEYARRMHDEGFKVVAYSHSVGTPICTPFNPFDVWPILEPGLAACDFYGYHAYFQPDYSPNDLPRFLRWRQAYERVSKSSRRPIFLSEAGIDGPGGYKNFNNARMDIYIEQLKRAEAQIWSDSHWADHYVLGAQLFIYGRDSERWISFDPSDNEKDRQQLIDYFKSAAPVRQHNNHTEPDSGTSPNPEPIPPEEPKMLSQEGRASITPALTKFAIKHRLGDLSYGEVYPKEAGHDYVAAVYSIDGTFTGVVTEIGHWDDTDFLMFDPITGAEITVHDPGPQPQPGACAFVIPKVLQDVAITGIPATPEVGQPFFRLESANITLGVSAFMVITVYGSNKLPLDNVQVVNLFPDGRGEIVETAGGIARFQFGASSAYTLPAQGPFTIFIADGAVKDPETKMVSWNKRLSHAYKGFGDVNGQHSQISLTIAQCQ